MLAPAKVNLLLSVGARQEDGLHELVSIMQSVSLFDEISIEPDHEFSLFMDGPPGWRDVPDGDQNLAMKAARAFGKLHLHPSQGVRIGLKKRIPVGGGLGGGSTDAAAVLVGLREATGGEVSRKALERLAARLGSDVPFCVRGGTCVVEGTGERLTSLPVKQPLWWVIGETGVHCSTAEVYERFDQMTASGSLSSGGMELSAAPQAIADALAKGDLSAAISMFANDLETPALDLHPELAQGRDALRKAGATGVVLAGSGSSWLGACVSEDEARAVAEACQGSFQQVSIASGLDHGPVEADG